MTKQLRRRRAITWLMAILTVSGTGVLALVVRETVSAEIAAAPVYTFVPDAGLTTEADVPVTPGAPAVPGLGPFNLPRWLAAAELETSEPPAGLAVEAEATAAAPVTVLAPLSFRLFLPAALLDYTPPPRQPEPFLQVTGPETGEWPAEAPTMSLSRLGLHALGPRDPDIIEFIRRAKPRVVKSVGFFEFLAEVKQISPETVTIGRNYGQDESVVNAQDPAEAAAAYIQASLATYQANPLVDYWEGWNEFVYTSPDQLRWYAAFEAARACQMQALGFRAAVGGFAVGWPNTYPEMELFLPALEAAHACNGLFHLHEYNRPLMQCAVRTGEANLIPGAPALTVPAGPLTFRYRFWYEGLLKPRNLGDLPLVISEYGIDAVPPISCPEPDTQNWRTWKDLSGWWQQQGYGADGPAAYVNQLAWADREMRFDAYVVGATIFTAGALDSGDQWNAHDIHDVLKPLARYLVSQH